MGKVRNGCFTAFHCVQHDGTRCHADFPVSGIYRTWTMNLLKTVLVHGKTDAIGRRIHNPILNNKMGLSLSYVSFRMTGKNPYSSATCSYHRFKIRFIVRRTSSRRCEVMYRYRMSCSIDCYSGIFSVYYKPSEFSDSENWGVAKW